MAHWNRVSEQWSALSNGINGDVHALVYSNGLLYAGGGFTAAGAVTANDVAFWDGTAWHAFGDQARIYERSAESGEIDTYVNALAVAGDLVFIGGHFQTIQYGLDTNDVDSFVVMHNLVAWDSRNDRWQALGTPLNPGVSNNGHSGFGVEANTLALVGDMLYVGGAFNQAGAVAATNLARYSLATGEWSASGNSVGGFDDSLVLALAPYGTDLFIGGHFTVAGRAPANFVARFDTLTDQWSALGSGVEWQDDRLTYVYSLATAASGIYVGGDFDQAGGHSAPGFARWAGPLAGGNVTAEEGGQVEGPGGLTIEFPAGATEDELVVRLAALTGPRQALPEKLRSVRNFNAAATTVTGQAVTGFLKPYTLTVPYTAKQLATAGVSDPATLNLSTWDGSAWQPLLPCIGCSLDAANRVVTVVTGHVGEFALVGAVAESDPEANLLFLPLVRGAE